MNVCVIDSYSFLTLSHISVRLTPHFPSAGSHSNLRGDCVRFIDIFLSLKPKLFQILPRSHDITLGNSNVRYVCRTQQKSVTCLTRCLARLQDETPGRGDLGESGVFRGSPAGVQNHKIRERKQRSCAKLAGGEGKRAVWVPGGWMTRQVGGEGRAPQARLSAVLKPQRTECEGPTFKKYRLEKV